MLVVARKPNESVVISSSDGIHRLLNVRIVAINGSVVTLGFDMDSTMILHRKEVLDKVRGVQQPPPAFMSRPLEVARFTPRGRHTYHCQD